MRRFERGPGPLQRHSRNAVVAALACVLSSLVGFAAFAASRGDWLRDPLYADKADRLMHRITGYSRNGDPPLTIVMFGSSRTSNAFGPVHTAAFADVSAMRDDMGKDSTS